MTNHQTDIYGLLVDPDYDSCLEALPTTTTPGRRHLLDDTPGGIGATNAEIRAAKREARRRKKEARLAGKGLDHKLKKLKRVKKVGGLVVKAGTRKWRKEQKKRERLAAWRERKQQRQQIHKGLAAVGDKGLLAASALEAGTAGGEGAEVEGVRVGTINAALSSDKGFHGMARGVSCLRGMRRWAFKPFRHLRRGFKHLKRLHHGAGGKGKGQGQGGGKPQQRPLVRLV